MTYSNLRACDADLYLKNFLFWHILVIETDTKPSQNTTHNKEKLTKCLSCTIYYISCQSLHKKWFFTLKIFWVHVTKSTVSYQFPLKSLFLRTWSHLLNKPLIENSIFCAENVLLLFQRSMVVCTCYVINQNPQATG